MNDVLREIIIESTKDILKKNLSVTETYEAIRRLYVLGELELRILLDSIKTAKTRQIENRRKDLIP